MDTFDSYILFIIIALPLAGAVVLMLTPGDRPGRVRWTASAVALAEMLLSFYIFLVYYLDYSETGGLQFEHTWNWLAIPGPWEFEERAITLTLGVDGLSAPMVLLTGIVMFTRAYLMKRSRNIQPFWNNTLTFRMQNFTWG